MKTPTIQALITATAVMMVACKNKQTPPDQSAVPASNRESAASIPESKPVYAVSDTFQAALGKVFDDYAGIQEALAQDDLEKARSAFSSMHAVLHMMPVDQLDSSAKAYWDSTDARIMAILHPMATAATLEAFRDHFVDFSTVMIDAVGKFGLRKDNPAYLFHCPMAKDNKGADWLQKDTALANPYFGKTMLTCGELVRRISE